MGRCLHVRFLKLYLTLSQSWNLGMKFHSDRVNLEELTYCGVISLADHRSLVKSLSPIPLMGFCDSRS